MKFLVHVLKVRGGGLAEPRQVLGLEAAAAEGIVSACGLLSTRLRCNSDLERASPAMKARVALARAAYGREARATCQA